MGRKIRRKKFLWKKARALYEQEQKKQTSKRKNSIILTKKKIVMMAGIFSMSLFVEHYLWSQQSCASVFEPLQIFSEDR